MNLNEYLPPKHIAELKPWYFVHVDLIVTDSKSIIQQQPGGIIFTNNVSLTCMTMMDPTIGSLEIIDIPMYNLNEVMVCNDDYIDNSSDRVTLLFNNTCLSIYLLLLKVMFDNRSEFKQEFTNLLNNFDIKLVLNTINNAQSHALVKWLHQLLFNMLATKDLYNKVFNYIDTWYETLASIALAIQDSYHRTNMVTSLQTDFGR